LLRPPRRAAHEGGGGGAETAARWLASGVEAAAGLRLGPVKKDGSRSTPFRAAGRLRLRADSR